MGAGRRAQTRSKTASKGRLRERAGSEPRSGAGRLRGGPQATDFVFYVEGARDRDILRSWARRLHPSLPRELDRCTVILGGRQPDRARRHFREERIARPLLRGLCVLDRDGETDAAELASFGGSESADASLEFFTWPRRHIESYLLVPAAIRRAAAGADPGRLDRALAEYIPNTTAHRDYLELHAKRLLEPGGPLFRGNGSAPRASDLARSMRAEEIHADVHGLLDRIHNAMGRRPNEVPIVVKRPPLR